MQTYDPYEFSRILASIIHPIGLACSTIILLALFAMLIADFKLVNRTSTRFVVGITVANLLAQATDLSATINQSMAGTFSCQVLIIVRGFTYFYQPLVNLSMANHLYRTHVNHHITTPIYELISWGLLFFLIGIIMIMMYCIGLFNLHKFSKVCNPTSNSKELNKIYGIMLVSLNLFCMLYALYVFIDGSRKLNKRKHTSRYSFEADKREIHGYKIKLRKIAKRLFWYPLVTLISLSSQTAVMGMIITGNFYEDVFPLKTATVGLSGILTFLVFLRDPVNKISFKIFLYEFRNKLTVRKLQRLSRDSEYNLSMNSIWDMKRVHLSILQILKLM